ncbi:hypothetical protein B0T14DRAFT_559958 [Immersiella caudata]|uniref:Uncharacterized protein n=1 Tax=Immersiella caudata TaxID=314043 RepID=A0AA39XEM8_9PEZI|nr:hypothetical protein B0T14DRAFT_559958 [Immersiella caudata]
MSDDILRNMSSHFNIPIDGPYPPVVDIASDQLISSHDSHSGDVSLTEADHEPEAVAVEDHDGGEYSLEVASRLLDLGGSPGTDSGASLMVNLGTPSPGSVEDGFVQADDDTEYRTSTAEEALPCLSEPLTSSLWHLRTSSFSDNNSQTASPSQRLSRASIVTNGHVSAGLEYTPRVSDNRVPQRARPHRNDISSRILRNGIATRRTPRSAPDVFPYPQRQVRFRVPRQEAEDEEESLYSSSPST